jgi:Serine aminopeptidase, S33
MATFILVHGTWSKAAHWPALRDGLALTATERGEQSRFEELRWSGANRASARYRAASDIFSLVQKIRSTAPNEKLFMIGHSHGGSAIAYFLKQNPTLAKTLSGCAFLSTPFIAIRPKEEAVAIFRGIGIVLAFAFSILYPYSFIRLFGGDYLSDAPVLYPSAFLILGIMALFFYIISKRYDTPKKMFEEMHQWQTADLPAGNYLFLRCSGDEAAAGLSAVQLIAWTNVKVSQLLALITKWIVASRALRGLSLFFLIFIFGWWTSFPSSEARNEMISLYKAAGEGNIVRTVIFTVLIWSFQAAHYLVIGGAVGALIIFLAQALTARAFGWTGLTTGLFVELAIEPLPFGVNSMTHIDWSANPLRLQGMTHSWTYADPNAIRAIQDWVKATLQRPQT